MRGLEEWPSCWVKPADRIRLTGPAAFEICRWLLVVGKTLTPGSQSTKRISEAAPLLLDWATSGRRIWPTTDDRKPTTRFATIAIVLDSQLLTIQIFLEKKCPHPAVVLRFAAAVRVKKKL